MKGRKSENIRKLKEEKQESKGNGSHGYYGRFVFISTSTKRLHIVLFALGRTIRLSGRE